MPGVGQNATSAAKLSGAGGAQMAGNALSALLSFQTDGAQDGGPKGPPPSGPPPSAADIASKLISALDTDGDDGLSLSEVSSALKSDSKSSDSSSREFDALDTMNASANAYAQPQSLSAA